MDRRLGAVERMAFVFDQGASLNFVVVAQVKGPLPPAALRSGLDAVRERHPNLRRRIVIDEKGVPVFRDGGAPLPVREVEGGDWCAEVERELNERFSTETGPLVRCVVIKHAAEDHSIFITYHHCIADAVSGKYLVRDLLMAVAAAQEGLAFTPAPLPSPPAIDRCFPASARGLSGGLRCLRLVLRESWMLLRHGKPLKMRRDREAFAHQRQARVIHEELDAVFTARLTARARAEGTTVHGALSAAMLLTVLHDAEVKGSSRVLFGSPVDLREMLAPGGREDVGLYIAMLTFNGPVSSNQGFWELARAIRDSIVADLSRGEAFTTLRVSASLLRLLGGHALEPARLCERWEKAVPSTMGLTNIGRADIPARFGQILLEKFHFLASPSVLGDFVAAVSSLHGRIFWNFIWTTPVFTALHARALVDGMLTRLRQAVDGPEPSAYAAASQVEAAPHTNSRM